MSQVFDKTAQALAASLKFRSTRHNITSSNIANAETPGYKAKKMDFEDALARSIDLDGMRGLTTTSGEHFSVGGGSVAKTRADIYDNPDGPVTNDGNTVDLEQEMAIMQENSILYKAALQLMNKKLGSLKYAASDGGR